MLYNGPKSGLKSITGRAENPEEESVKGKTKTGKVGPKYVELLEERVEELKEDKARLQEKVDNLEQRLLPPEKKQGSVLNRFLNWLSGK